MISCGTRRTGASKLAALWSFFSASIFAEGSVSVDEIKSLRFDMTFFRISTSQWLGEKVCPSALRMSLSRLKSRELSIRTCSFEYKPSSMIFDLLTLPFFRSQRSRLEAEASKAESKRLRTKVGSAFETTSAHTLLYYIPFRHSFFSIFCIPPLILSKSSPASLRTSFCSGVFVAKIQTSWSSLIWPDMIQDSDQETKSV